MGKVRTFIALEIDDDTRDELVGVLDVLAHRAPRVHWADPDSLHATLKFLGDLPADDLPELFDAVARAAARVEPFVWSLAGTGVFPHERAPKVVWAGVTDGFDEVGRLAAAMEDACAELGYPPEARPYTPHVTLGRVKYPADAEGLPDARVAVEGEYGFLDADAVTVFMSDLRRTGRVYAPMFRAPLGRRAGPPPVPGDAAP